jgi:hypothetical protein
MSLTCLWCKKRLVGSRFRIGGTPYSVCPEHVGGRPHSEVFSLGYIVECTWLCLLSRCAAPPARILHGRASGEESIDDIVRALENDTVRDLHVRELDLSGTLPPEAAAPRAQLAPAGAFHFATHDSVLQPKSVATAGCLAGAGGRVKVGTRAWDGLLEALRASLIAALFLHSMFSYAVSLARPLQAVHQPTRCSKPV